MSVITIERNILEKNDAVAGRNRTFFATNRIHAINLVSSPGSGKTALLERTLERCAGSLRIAVIEGDVQTDLDARRIARHNVPALQIVTRGGCHLDAPLVEEALRKLDRHDFDLIFIENVGNLVCPANYDLGEAMKIVVASTTEGDDKPLKYPEMFRRAGALVINKIDLLPYIDCNPALLKENALSINPSLTMFETSCTTGEGIDAWCDWLKQQTMLAREQAHA